MPTALEKQSRARDQRLVLKNIGIKVPALSKKPARPASIKTIERSYLKDVLILLEPMYIAVKELLVPEIPLLVESFNESVKIDAINYAESLSKIFEQLSLEMVLTVPNPKIGAEC